MNFKKGDRVKRNPEWYKENWVGKNRFNMKDIWEVSWCDDLTTHFVDASCLETMKLMLVKAAKAERVVDPLTIRKITCKSTGLPLKRIREIKKALREAYGRELNKPYRYLFEKGKSIGACFIWRDQPEGESRVPARMR